MLEQSVRPFQAGAEFLEQQRQSFDREKIIVRKALQHEPLRPTGSDFLEADPPGGYASLPLFLL